MYKAVLIVCGLTISLFVSAQKKYVGLWEGKLNIGVEMRLIFNIVEEAPDRLTTSMDVPEQGLKGIKVSSTSIVNDSLKIEISQFRASFIGKMENDSLILGSFQQQVSVPIILRKIKQVVEVVKKQTPVPPFPYQSENISYSNASKAISYGATITIPNGKGPFPAVLLLTGSGQQNRDEEMLGHKPFAVIADHLTRNGYIVLRADDRGVGQTTGDPAYATSFDFSRDAIAGIEYLHSRKEVDKSRIGLIGHSEGAMIAQILGAERSDIKYIVSLAGPGSHTATLMSDQNRAIMAKAELPSDHVEAYMSLYDSILQIIIQHDKASFDSLVRRSLNSWVKSTPPTTVLMTTGVKDEKSKSDFITAFSAMANNDWFRYFLRYNPTEKIREFKGHYLALNGSEDIQVIAKPNLQATEKALKTGKAKSYEIHELKGLNHLFQECTKCTIQEYGELEQTISSKVLELMTDWLNKVSKL